MKTEWVAEGVLEWFHLQLSFNIDPPSYTRAKNPLLFYFHIFSTKSESSYVCHTGVATAYLVSLWGVLSVPPRTPNSLDSLKHLQPEVGASASSDVRKQASDR